MSRKYPWSRNATGWPLSRSVYRSGVSIARDRSPMPAASSARNRKRSSSEQDCCRSSSSRWRRINAFSACHSPASIRYSQASRVSRFGVLSFSSKAPSSGSRRICRGSTALFFLSPAGTSIHKWLSAGAKAAVHTVRPMEASAGCSRSSAREQSSSSRAISPDTLRRHSPSSSRELFTTKYSRRPSESRRTMQEIAGHSPPSFQTLRA